MTIPHALSERLRGQLTADDMDALARALDIPPDGAYQYGIYPGSNWGPAWSDYTVVWFGTHAGAVAVPEGTEWFGFLWRGRAVAHWWLGCAFLNGSDLYARVTWHPEYGQDWQLCSGSRSLLAYPAQERDRVLKGFDLLKEAQQVRGRRRGRDLSYEQIQAAFHRWGKDHDGARPTQEELSEKLATSADTIYRVCRADARGWPPPAPNT